MPNPPQERLIESQVTYTLELNGELIIIENVPARVNEETREQYFAPARIRVY
jgi:hypothetical protein